MSFEFLLEDVQWKFNVPGPLFMKGLSQGLGLKVK